MRKMINKQISIPTDIAIDEATKIGMTQGGEYYIFFDENYEKPIPLGDYLDSFKTDE